MLLEQFSLFEVDFCMCNYFLYLALCRWGCSFAGTFLLLVVEVHGQVSTCILFHQVLFGLFAFLQWETSNEIHRSWVQVHVHRHRLVQFVLSIQWFDFYKELVRFKCSAKFIFLRYISKPIVICTRVFCHLYFLLLLLIARRELRCWLRVHTRCST
jgi:hypothetical protein